MAFIVSLLVTHHLLRDHSASNRPVVVVLCFGQVLVSLPVAAVECEAELIPSRLKQGIYC